MRTNNLKDVIIDPSTHQVTKICTSLTKEEEHELVAQLIKNVDLFARAPSHMPDIYTKAVSHHLAIHHSAKLMAQRKRQIGEEKRATIEEETH